MLIFLYGDDTYRSRLKLREIASRFQEKADPAGLKYVDGENASFQDINEAVAAPSLFSNKRLVVVERLFANKSKGIRKECLDYFEASKHIPDDQDSATTVIFWEDFSGGDKTKDKLWGFLAKRKFAQEFKPLSATASTEWARAQAETRGVMISRQAASALSGLCGSDLWRLSGELDKLINYKMGLANPLEALQIEREDVESMVRGVFDENIFALTDAISQRNKGLAFELLEKEIDNGLAESYLLHMIERQFRILLQVRQGLDQGLSSRKLTTQLKLHPFVVQKCLLQVRHFSLPVLAQLFRKTISMDRSVKSGRIDVRTAVSLLVAAA
jgi:DNA polymerase-3 subunit delta